jgi:hypothetical protein
VSPGGAPQVRIWYEEIDGWLSGARWRKPLAALICYLILSSAFFLHLIPQGLNTSFIGWHTDESFFIWCLKWWPYAVAHHLNPFIPKLVFAPEGFNLAWATCAPLMAWLALPLTATLGPVSAYNLLCVLCPALNAWTAFILCRHVGARFWASLVGGWLFGFSPFVVGHILGGHLSLFPVFLLPLMVLAVLMRLEERIGVRSFILLLCALLVGEFLTSAEVFATLTVMGAIMLVVGWLFARGELRRRIQALFVPLEFAYLGAVVLLSPYLYYVWVGFRSLPYYPAEALSTNLLNLVVPVQTTSLWYAAPIFQQLSSSFDTTYISERGAYVGLPLLIVTGWFVIEHRRTVMSRTCATLAVMTTLLSMGPFAHVGRNIGWWLPWWVFTQMPLLDQALPIRLSIYAVLILAVLAAMWLTSAPLPLWIRMVAAVLIVASMFPNISRTFWRSPVVQIPTFFSDKGLYHHYLHKGETVAILPFAWGAGSQAMGWQAQTGMYFKMTTGYVLFTPPSYLRWPAIRAALRCAEIPSIAEQWKAFFASHNVSVLIVVYDASPMAMPQQKALQRKVLPSLGLAAVNIGGVSLYRIPPDALVRYRNATSLQMERLADEQRFAVSLVAARQYLVQGGNPANLSPISTAQRGLLPMEWISKEQTAPDFSVWLHVEPNGTIGVGLMGTYPALCPLIERYGRYAQRISFPYPEPLGEAFDVLGDVTDLHWLVMMFDRSGLDSAAALALAGSQSPIYLAPQ